MRLGFIMAWISPRHSRTEVDTSGEALVRPLEPDLTADEIIEEYVRALAVVNNWRSSHSFPLNSLQVNLRRNASRIYPGALVAQRIKRLAAIEAKLRRFPNLRLSQIQDLGGCRAVLRSVRDVRGVVELFKESRSQNNLHHEDDYVVAPRPSGYRGVHMIYQYRSESEKTAAWNNLRIEIQIRSRLQHAWATAVETVGAFVGQALKSSQGQGEWLRFFALMGSAIAVRERTDLVPDTPTNYSELVRELRHCARAMNVAARLRGYRAALKTAGVSEAGGTGSRFFLLVLDAKEETVSIRGYPMKSRQAATEDYVAAEKRVAGREGMQAVLVSVDSLASLRRAYPNYFADTRVFIHALETATR